MLTQRKIAKAASKSSKKETENKDSLQVHDDGLQVHDDSLQVPVELEAMSVLSSTKADVLLPTGYHRFKRLNLFKRVPVESNVCLGAYQLNYDWYLEFEHLEGVIHPTRCLITEHVKFQTPKTRLGTIETFKTRKIEKGDIQRPRRSKNILASEALDFIMLECPAGEFRMGSIVPTPLAARIINRVDASKSWWGSRISRTEQLFLLASRQVSTVRLTKSFLLGETPVTRKLFRAVMGYYSKYENTWDDARQADLDTRKQIPLNNVNWFEAIVFCNRLSKLMGLEPYYSITDVQLVVKYSSSPEFELVKSFKSFDAVFEYGMSLYENRKSPDVNKVELNGLFVSPVFNFSIMERLIGRIKYVKIERNLEAKGYRLPTDAEWEYAARSGGENQLYPGSDNPKDVACFHTSKASIAGLASRRSLDPLKTLMPNYWGFYDMCGNVQEWCADHFKLPEVEKSGSYAMPLVQESLIARMDPCEWLGYYEQPVWDIERKGGDGSKVYSAHILRGGSSASSEQVSVFDKKVALSHQCCEMQPYSVYKGDFFGFRIARNL